MLVDLDCPACGKGVIQLELKLFAQGGSFSCSACGASLAVAPQSQETMEQGVKEFDQFKQEITQLRTHGNRPI